MPYKTVVFEIVGFCNAKCPWCPTGNRSMVDRPSRCIPPSEFEQAVERLVSEGLISSPESTVYLYNWGEPMLHPRLNDVLSILGRRSIRYALSTNASRFVNLDHAALTSLAELRFSVPGFSQAAYDRIHGFDLDTVRRNIVQYCDTVRQARSSAALTMSYHLYQFNLDEVNLAQQFCEDNGIHFMPYAAMLVDYSQAKAYLDHSISTELLRRVSRDLLLYYIEDHLESMPHDYRCPQFDILTIDEFANVVLCCVLPKTYADYSLGRLSELSAKDIRQAKETRAICSECLRLGIAYWHNTPLLLDRSATGAQRLEARPSAQAAEILRQEAHARELVRVIESMRGSLSWRLTAPLRVLGNLIRRSG